MTMDLPDYAIEASGLYKTYAATKTTPAKTALNGLDLKIPRGSIFGLLGPNGAGKSTFINILAGIVRKTSGQVRIWDRDIDTRPRDARACIGVVPQEIAADVFFTPRESMEVQAYVLDLNRKGVTVVLTTHYLEEAQELCDTIAIINRGEVVACEPTSQLLRRLDTRAVVITPQETLTQAPPLGRFQGELRPDGRLAVSFKTADAGVEAVLAAVREAGVAIKDLSTEDPSLEDVFMALTYDGGKDPTTY
jgi:ABC-type multidrug transport system ATPase subunit